MMHAWKGEGHQPKLQAKCGNHDGIHDLPHVHARFHVLHFHGLMFHGLMWGLGSD